MVRRGGRKKVEREDGILREGEWEKEGGRGEGG